MVGNEPNLNRFWMPQYGPDGADVAAPAYESLLARTYDAVKTVDPQITVIGGAVSPRGVDKPNTGRDTHSPVTFIPDLGGCNIGGRPIDFHLQALREFGAVVDKTPSGLPLGRTIWQDRPSN